MHTIQSVAMHDNYKLFSVNSSPGLLLYSNVDIHCGMDCSITLAVKSFYGSKKDRVSRRRFGNVCMPIK